MLYYAILLNTTIYYYIILYITTICYYILLFLGFSEYRKCIHDIHMTRILKTDINLASVNILVYWSFSSIQTAHSHNVIVWIILPSEGCVD